MRFRRHLPPLGSVSLRLPALSRRRVLVWAAWGAGAIVAGYLTAFFLLFPTPLFRARHPVPRVLGLARADAARVLRQASLALRDSGGEADPTTPAGTVIWQDPPPDVDAPEGTRVTILTSSGPGPIVVPDVTSYDTALARTVLEAGRLQITGADSVQVPRSTPGLVVQTRPPAGTVVTASRGVTLRVSQGAPTIRVPDLLNMTLDQARQVLADAGLALGAVTRRRTADQPAGTIIAQEPAAGTMAAAGVEINVVVAATPP